MLLLLRMSYLSPPRAATAAPRDVHAGEAIGKVLDNRKSPSRKVNEIDNRGTNFYLALYWAEAMAERDDAFVDVAQQLADNEGQILNELLKCQGQPVDIGGYYYPQPTKAAAAMRPSKTFNAILDSK